MKNLKLDKGWQATAILACSLILLIVFAVSANARCYRMVSEPSVNYIALVIDKSGSMSGQPIANARNGAKHFVSKMRDQDHAMIIEFNGGINVLQEFTNDHQLLTNAIEGIQADGKTALYNAMARAITDLSSKNSSKIIVFLTDGKDISSQYTANNIRTMSIAEGVFVYGIGLGNVDQSVLETITNSSNGSFEITQDPSDLIGIYDQVLSSYYQKFGNRSSTKGAVTVQSIPSARPVYLDRKQIGRTPLKLDNIDPGQYSVQVEFSQGRATCQFPVERGHRTMVDLRESDLGRDLVISSTYPANAAVFLDDNYVGTCRSHGPILTGDNWIEKLNQWPQLKIKNIPLGKHTILLRGIPDFDYGPEQEMTLELTITDSDPQPIYILADVIPKRLKHNAKRCKDVSSFEFEE